MYIALTELKVQIGKKSQITPPKWSPSGKVRKWYDRFLACLVVADTVPFDTCTPGASFVVASFVAFIKVYCARGNSLKSADEYKMRRNMV